GRPGGRRSHGNVRCRPGRLGLVPDVDGLDVHGAVAAAGAVVLVGEVEEQVHRLPGDVLGGGQGEGVVVVDGDAGLGPVEGVGVPALVGLGEGDGPAPLGVLLAVVEGGAGGGPGVPVLDDVDFGWPGAVGRDEPDRGP